MRHREVFDWPLASAAVVLTLDGRRVTKARVVLGHVAPIPWVSEEAAAALIGKTISEEVAAQAGSASGIESEAAEPKRIQSSTHARGGQTRHFAGCGLMSDKLQFVAVFRCGGTSTN